MLVISKTVKQKKASANVHRLRNDFTKFDPQTGIWNWVSTDNARSSQVNDWNIALLLATEVLRVAESLSKGLDSPGIEELFTLAKETAVDPQKGFRTVKNLLGKLHNLGVGLSFNEDIVPRIYTYPQINKIVCWMELALNGKAPTWLKEFKNSWLSNNEAVVAHCKNAMIEWQQSHAGEDSLIPLVVTQDEQVYIATSVPGFLALLEKGQLVRRLNFSLQNGEWVVV